MTPRGRKKLRKGRLSPYTRRSPCPRPPFQSSMQNTPQIPAKAGLIGRGPMVDRAEEVQTVIPVGDEGVVGGGEGGDADGHDGVRHQHHHRRTLLYRLLKAGQSPEKERGQKRRGDLGRVADEEVAVDGDAGKGDEGGEAEGGALE